jgi:hypothetical protein
VTTRFVEENDTAFGVEETSSPMTRYPVIGAPPVILGAVHDTNDRRSTKPLTTTAVGASGTVAGVAVVDEADATEVPDTFVAVTLNV